MGDETEKIKPKPGYAEIIPMCYSVRMDILKRADTIACVFYGERRDAVRMCRHG